MFGSPQLRCDLSGLSVILGESQTTQSLKVRDLVVTFDQFLNFDDHILYIEAHIFILETLEINRKSKSI